jgi:uncharacterized protein (TIGR01777 family)
MWLDSNALDQVTHIIHLAGASISKKWTPEYKQTIVDSRTKGLHTLKKYLSKADLKIDKILSASGIGYYQPNTGKTLTEMDPKGNGFLSDVCNLWELNTQMLSPFADKILNFRIGMVLDKNEGGLPMLLKMAKYGVASPIGSGNQKISWIHIQDLVSLICFGLEQHFNGVYNAVSPLFTDNKQFIKILARTMKRPVLLPNVPSAVLKLRFGQMSCLILESLAVSSDKILNEGFAFKYPDLEDALDQIINQQ